jgi:hypothetical protein
MSGYLLALGITLVLETPIVAALYPGRRLRLAVVCALASTATHLFMHVLLPGWLPRGVSALQVGEAVATLAEAAAYAVAARGEVGRALVASALANSASFGAGLLLFGR